MTRRALREISEIARKLAENESRPCTAFSRHDRLRDDRYREVKVGSGHFRACFRPTERSQGGGAARLGPQRVLRPTRGRTLDSPPRP